MTLAPSIEGLQLFLWGQGYGKDSVSQYLSEKIVCPSFDGIQIDGFGEYKQYDVSFNK